jgi:GT2 family glycosyltransferase
MTYMIDITIVIPAYKPYTLLKRCVDSIINTTDLSRACVVVVCNGSDRESADYILNLNNPSITLVWCSEALGYPKATNIGIKISTTPYIILLNSDVILFQQPKHWWVEKMVSPLRTTPNLAITGLTQVWLFGRSFFPFAHVALKREIFEKLGYIDETFSPGYGEDIDYCFKITDAGYDSLIVADLVPDDNARTNLSSFPIFHGGKESFGDERGTALQTRGFQIIKQKYFNK